MSSLTGNDFEYCVRTNSVFTVKLIVNCCFSINIKSFSIVFRWILFLLKDKMSIMLSIRPNVWPSSSKCCVNFDEVLLFLKDRWCSLYLKFGSLGLRIHSVGLFVL